MLIDEQERLAIKAWRDCLRQPGGDNIPPRPVMELVYGAARKIKAAAAEADGDHRRSGEVH